MKPTSGLCLVADLIRKIQTFLSLSHLVVLLRLHIFLLLLFFFSLCVSLVLCACFFVVDFFF